MDYWKSLNRAGSLRAIREFDENGFLGLADESMGISGYKGIMIFPAVEPTSLWKKCENNAKYSTG